MTYSAKLLWAAILVFSTLECANTQTQSSGPAGSATNGAGVFHVFGGVSEPHVIYAPKAEYSEEARRQKIEGVCVVILTVGQDGVPRNIRVKQTLRSDLDAKAVEAVEKWRYEPAMKDGKPMSLMTTAEVEFRIESDNVRIRELQKKADTGDLKAQLELSRDYFQGLDVTKSEGLGYKFLRQAAENGLPEAQYEMGEYDSGKGSGSVKYVDAFVWYSLAQRSGYKGSAKRVKEITKRLSADDLGKAKYQLKNWQPSK
jgi:TonB family protein